MEARKTGQQQDEAVAGLSAFEEWLEALLNAPTLEQIVSSLSPGEPGVSSWQGARPAAKQPGRSPANRLLALDTQETAALAQRQKQFKREVDDALLGLSTFKGHLAELGAYFEYQCVQAVQDLIDCDERWASQEKLRVCFESAIAAYANAVNQRTRAELKGLPVPVLIFEPGARGAIEVGTIKDSSAMLAVGAGMVLNTLLESGLPGSSFVNWIKKSLLTDDARQKLLETVQQGALEILPALRREAEAYLGQMEALVRRFGQTHQPTLEPSASLQAARQIEDYYRGLDQWARNFQHALESVQQTLARSSLPDW